MTPTFLMPMLASTAKLNEVFRSVVGDTPTEPETVGPIATMVLLLVAAVCLTLAVRYWLQMRETTAYQRWAFERRVYRALGLSRSTRHALRAAARQLRLTSTTSLLLTPSLLREAIERAAPRQRSLLEPLLVAS